MSEPKAGEKLVGGMNTRDFLKVGAVASGALIAGKYVNRSSGIVESKVGQENEWREVIGADGFKYIPIYEQHKEPWPATKFVNLPDVDVAFYEIVRRADGMQNATAEELTGKAPERFIRDRYVTKDQLSYWGEKGTFLGFEGLDYNTDGMSLRMAFGTVIEGFGGVLALAKSFDKNVTKDISIGGKGVISGETIKNSLRYGGIWGSSSFVDLGISMYLNVLSVNGSEGIDDGSLKARRISGLISQVHPEIDVTFFRNMIMARRLQALGEYFPAKYRETDRVANSPKTIAYTVGAKHIGVEDWLQLGPDIVKLGLEMTPPAVWKELADLNGGTEAMATMPLVRPGSMLFDDKIVKVKDEWFSRFLLRKVDRE